MENPIKMDDLGGKNPILGNIHMNHPLSLAPDFVLSKAAPLRYSGTLNPTLNLTAQQMEMLQSKLGTQHYQQPGPRTRTLGYRGFVVQGLPVIRGCVSAVASWWKTPRSDMIWKIHSFSLIRNLTKNVSHLLWIFHCIPILGSTNPQNSPQGTDAELYLLELFRPQLPETRRTPSYRGSSETPGKSSDGLHWG